jgi:hypothetical protein
MGAVLAGAALAGCGGSTEPKPAAASSAAVSETATADEPAEEATTDSTAPSRTFKAVALGSNAEDSPAGPSKPVNEAENMASVVQALQPLQIMLGKWRGTTQKKFNGFNAVEELDWVWDFRTDRAQPALVTTSDNSQYMRSGRLTYLPREKKYQLTLTPPKGEPKILQGTWEEEPADANGDDDKPQRTYKLALQQVAPMEEEQWQVVFNQRDNNRYHVELSRKRGSGEFMRVDTVGTQRANTSFALNDEDYKDRKCIISGGLGTIQVSYKGKSYWVCCTGCKAAFEEEPERWLAKLPDKDKP